MSGCFACRSTPKDGCKSLQWTVREQGLEFLCPDIGVAGENSLSREWKPGDSIALTVLAERLRMLPEKGGELFL